MIEDILKHNAESVNSALEKYLDLKSSDFDILYESMRYSTLSGGKRVRAFLTLEFFKLFYSDCGVPGAPDTHALQIILPVACAVEMIHTYSLIHDDLPCMDDDDLRRGLPSSHKKFGEAAAVLTGDALLTYAFNIIADAEFLPDGEKIRIISEISRAAGHSGMIGGQIMDISDVSDVLHENKNKNIDIVRLIKTHSLKTSCMMIAAARSGCIAGGAGGEETEKAADYAKNIGLAFQVIDDILDGQNPEMTFDYARKLTAEAKTSLDEIKKIKRNADTKNLEEFADYLLERAN